MNNKQQPPLPTLQPGDSHMESLIEAAIQGHASTRDAMRWLVRQLVPATQPAEVTDEKILTEVLAAGGKQYGNDGKYIDIEHSELLKAARAILALRPVQVPMTMKQIEDMALQEQFLLICDGLDELTIIVEAIEAHHGITVKVKNEAL